MLTGLLVGVIAAAGIAQAAAAETAEPDAVAEAPSATRPTASSLESWAGADITRHYGSIWSGLTWAPLGSLTEDGWRLRTVTGAGRYAYDGWMLASGIPVPARFRGQNAFLDGLIGYHLQLGGLTLKPFAGVGMVQHAVAPLDPVTELTGRAIGVKVALDSWLRLGPAAWLNVDGSWFAVHNTAAIKMRLGTRIWEDLSIGVEASALSDVNQEMRRAGLFLRFAWEAGEVSIGGGLTGNAWAETARTAQPYAGISALGQF